MDKTKEKAVRRHPPARPSRPPPIQKSVTSRGGVPPPPPPPPPPAPSPLAPEPIANRRSIKKLQSPNFLDEIGLQNRK